MIGNKYEALSALIDGECEEIVGLLKQVSADSKLKTRWEEHYRARVAMQSEYAPSLGSNFSSRVSAPLEKEPVVFAPPVANSKSIAEAARWKRPS